MKKLQKSMALILALALSFALMVPAMAVDERYQVLECPQCITGAVRVTEKREYAHDETFPCRHGHEGAVDYYAAYKHTFRFKCESCTYDVTNETIEHEFKACGGR